MSDEELIEINGVTICVATFGSPEDPPILLIQGNGGSMLWWEDEFCTRLAAAGRFVIRYDHRDTGRSVTYEPGQPGYAFVDLIEDAAGVLDVTGVDQAHVVGISMGGAIAQLLTLAHPDRVASLTLISTSPAAPGAEDLPPMSPDLLTYFSSDPTPDWSDPVSVVEYLVEFSRRLAAHSAPFDDAACRALVVRDVERASNMASTVNHSILEPGAPSGHSLGEITAPTLILHGTEDPLFPYGHGQALAKEIPTATLLPMDQTGHEIPSRTWETVLPALIQHTS